MTLTVSNTQYLVTTSTSAAMTCPAGSAYTLLKVNAINKDTVPRYLTAWRVGSGGSVSDTNLMLPATSMAVGSTTLPFSGQTLVGGQTLQVKATATAIMILSIGYAITNQ